MPLFSLTIAKSFEAAAGACCRRFALATGLGALLTFPYLTPATDTMQVYERVAPIEGVRMLLWITVIIGLAIATLTVLDTVQTESGSVEGARARAAQFDLKSGAQAMRAWFRGQGMEP